MRIKIIQQLQWLITPVVNSEQIKLRPINNWM